MTSRIQQLRQEVRRRRSMRRKVTVALDVMGTDIGPEEILQGAVDAVKEYPSVTVVCAGPKARLAAILRHRQWEHSRILIEDAPEVVGMHEVPRDSLRKKGSSVAVAARLVHDKLAHAMVSAGNTGATMAHAMMMWRKLPGISRPAIAAFIPHPKHPCILLDAGANVDCKARNLLHFAIMGSVYVKYMFHRQKPLVGLLSIGEEETKGNELVFEAQKLLRESTLNYHGNIEGRDIVKGEIDIVVCDGFVGNIVIKFGEGIAELIFKNLKEELSRNLVSQLGALAMLPAFRSLKKRVDYSEYGGAPLLGLNGVCVICHGSSRAKAIKNGIRVAAEMVDAKVNDHIVDLAARNNPSASD
jgi:phosphate acyltransferase